MNQNIYISGLDVGRPSIRYSQPGSTVLRLLELGADVSMVHVPWVAGVLRLPLLGQSIHIFYYLKAVQVNSTIE